MSTNGQRHTGINRLIIVGNGFDLAHKLPTKYCDFIDWLWRNISTNWSSPLVTLRSIDIDFMKNIGPQPSYLAIEKQFDKQLERTKNTKKLKEFLDFRNDFFRRLHQEREISEWVDMEMFYFKLIKDLMIGLSERISSPTQISQRLQILNSDMDELVSMFDEYLDTEVVPKISEEYLESIGETIFDNPFLRKNNVEMFLDEFPFDPVKTVVNGRVGTFADRIKSKVCEGSSRQFSETCVLNFNYTNTPELYRKFDTNMKFIYIHGRVRTVENPLILGFGDENNASFKAMEDFNNYEFLRMSKSVKYPRTSSHKRLMDFISSAPFQAQIVGHSCAISDRTLLSAIFENTNCISIKPYYYKYAKPNQFGESDNFTELIANIGRHFSDKKIMRRKIVNKELCTDFSGRR